MPNLAGPKGGWALEAHPAGLGPSTEEALGALGLAQRRGPLDRNSGGPGAGAGALCESMRGRGAVETKQRMQGATAAAGLGDGGGLGALFGEGGRRSRI